MFRKASAGLDHVCFSVAGYNPDVAFERLHRLGLDPLRSEDGVFLRGPDGILFQVADPWGDYPEP